MKALEVDYIINIKMEITDIELSEIVKMGEEFLDIYGSDEIHDYRDTIMKLKQMLQKVNEFRRDSTITLGYKWQVV